MSSDFVSASFDHAERIDEVARELRTVHKALRIAGITDLADRLRELDVILTDEAQTARDLCSDRTRSDLAKSEEMTRAVVGLAFAGFSRVEAGQ